MTARILITGAGGGVGTLMRSRLAAEGRVLRLLDIAELPAAADGENVELVQASVTDMAGLRRARDFMKDLHVEVQKAVKKGLSRQEAARTVRLDSYPDIKPAFRTLANGVLAIYDETRSHR